jgi:hypothetical protein
MDTKVKGTAPSKAQLARIKAEHASELERRRALIQEARRLGIKVGDEYTFSQLQQLLDDLAS